MKKRSTIAYTGAFAVILIFVTAVCLLACRARLADISVKAVCDLLENSGREQVATLNASFSGQNILLKTLPSSIDMTTVTAETVERLHTAAATSDFAYMGILTGDGTLYLDNGEVYNGFTSAPPEVRQDSGVFVLFYQESVISSTPIIIVGAPAADNSGAFVCGIYNESHFKHLLHGKTMEGEYTYLCSSDGYVIVRSEDEGYSVDGRSFLSMLETAKIKNGLSYEGVSGDLAAGRSGIVEYEYNGEESYAVYLPTGIADWMLLNVIPGDVVNERISESVTSVYIFLIIIMGCSLLLFALLVLFAARSFKKYRSAQQNVVARLRSKAQVDGLTGLLNRTEATSQIIEYLSGEGAGGRHALFIVDMDNFKLINDNFGHFDGDRVLTTVSSNLKSVFRSTDIVGRLGGDEFIVCLKNAESDDVVLQKAAELGSRLEFIHSGEGMSVTLTSSIGISVFENGDKNFESLYREADEALYRAKQTGKSKFCMYGENEDSEGSSKPSVQSGSASIQLQALMDNIDGGIVLFEVGEVIKALYLSSSFIRMEDIKEKNVQSVSADMMRFIDQSDSSAVDRLLREGADSGDVIDAVFRIPGKSTDRLRWRHMRAVRIPYEDSVFPVMIAVITDITRVKHTELELRAQKLQLESVLSISRVVTFEIDPARRTMRFMYNSGSRYGFTDEIIENVPEGIIAAGAVHKDSIDNFRAFYEDIFSGVKQGSTVVRVKNRDGVYCMERYTFVNVFGDDGKPVKAMCVDEALDDKASELLHYDYEMRLFKYHSDQLLNVVRVRLSDEALSFMKQGDVADETVLSVRNYTEFLELRLASMPDPGERAELQKLCNISALRELSSTGKVFMPYCHRLTGSDGFEHWQAVLVSTVFNPNDGESYALLKTRNFDSIKRVEREMGGEIRLESRGFMYDSSTFNRYVNFVLNKKDRVGRCGVAILRIRQFGDMKRRIGEYTVESIFAAAIRKLMLVNATENVMCKLGAGSLAIFLPGLSSRAALDERLDKYLKLLRNPALFERPEEAFIRYAIGVALEKGDGAVRAEALLSEALAAADALIGNIDRDVQVSTADAVPGHSETHLLEPAGSDAASVLSLIGCGDTEVSRIASTFAESMFDYELGNSTPKSMLKILGEYYGADRAYVLSIDSIQDTITNVCEWCAAGVDEVGEYVRKLPLNEAPSYIHALNEMRVLRIDTQSSRSDDKYSENVFLESKGVGSLISAPFKMRYAETGFVGMDDPKKNTNDLRVLQAAAFFVPRRLVFDRFSAADGVDLQTGLPDMGRYVKFAGELDKAKYSSIGAFAARVKSYREPKNGAERRSMDAMLEFCGSVFMSEFGSGYSFRLDQRLLAAVEPDVAEQDLMRSAQTLKRAVEDAYPEAFEFGVWWSAETCSADEALTGAVSRLE